MAVGAGTRHSCRIPGLHSESAVDTAAFLASHRVLRPPDQTRRAWVEVAEFWCSGCVCEWGEEAAGQQLSHRRLALLMGPDLTNAHSQLPNKMLPAVASPSVVFTVCVQLGDGHAALGPGDAQRPFLLRPSLCRLCCHSPDLLPPAGKWSGRLPQGPNPLTSHSYACSQ